MILCYRLSATFCHTYYYINLVSGIKDIKLYYLVVMLEFRIGFAWDSVRICVANFQHCQFEFVLCYEYYYLFFKDLFKYYRD